MEIVKFTNKDKEDAFRLRQELKQLRASATEISFLVGERLKEIRDRQLWRMGHDTFEAYLADPDIAIKRSSGYHAIKLVETFPEWKELVEVPVSKLIMIAPHVTDKNREEMIAEAKALSRSDLGFKLREEGVITPRDRELPKTYRCNDCGYLKGINFSDLCRCGLSKKQFKYLCILIQKCKEGDYLG